MKKSKLYLLIQHLGREERQFLADFFCQPYFSDKHAHLQSLLNYVLQHRQQADAMEHAAIFAHLFGADALYNDLKLRHIIADVLHHAEIALAYYHAGHDDLLWLPLQILQLYSQLNLPKHYRAVLTTIEGTLQDYPYRNADYYLQQYRFYRLQEQFSTDRTDPAKQIARVQASDSLDIFYITEKLRMMSELRTLQQVRKTANSIALSDTLLTAIAQNPHYLQYPLLAAYYYIWQMLDDDGNSDNDSWFEQLKTLINATALPLLLEEAQEIYFFALNYCAVQINKGTDSYLAQIFDLYQLGLKNKWLLDYNNTLSAFHYKNVTTVALRLERYEWIKQFLHDYCPLLPNAQRDTAFRYNIANYHFYRGEYEQVLLLLQQVSHDEIFYSLDTRLLLLKTYYELDETDVLFSLIESTNQMLNRTKQLSRERQRTYRNFLKFIRKLSSLSTKKSKKAIALHQSIEQSTHLADKRWLLSKFAP